MTYNKFEDNYVKVFVDGKQAGVLVQEHNDSNHWIYWYNGSGVNSGESSDSDCYDYFGTIKELEGSFKDDFGATFDEYL